MNTQDPKYQQKSKSISSPEQNYFALFAMRYPVGRDEHSCYIWAMVFVLTKCCRYFAIPTISIIRLISILVEKYQIQYSTNLKLVVFASLVSLAATMVAVLPIKPVLHIGFFAQVSLYSVQKYLNKKDASKKLF